MQKMDYFIDEEEISFWIIIIYQIYYFKNKLNIVIQECMIKIK